MRFVQPVLVTLLVCFGLKGHSLDIPEQFKTKNAATVLGLSDKQEITASDVNQAFRKLMMLWHPDKFSGSEFTKADRDTATLISKLISEARVTLVGFLRDSTMPQSGSGSEPFTAENEPDDSQSAWDPNPQKPGGFDWNDTFSETGTSDSMDIVSDPSERLLGRTLFGNLAHLPDLKKAVMTFELGRVDKSSNRTPTVGEVVIIIEPAKFPFIELRYFDLPDGTNKPRVMKIRRAKYVRNRHVGGMAGAGMDDDGIAFGWGNYLKRAFLTGQPTHPFIPVPTAEPGVYQLEAKNRFLFVEMKATGYATPYFLDMKKRDITGLIGAPVQATWKDVEIPASKVIQLPWLNGECESTLDTVTPKMPGKKK